MNLLIIFAVGFVVAFVGTTHLINIFGVIPTTIFCIFFYGSIYVIKYHIDEHDRKKRKERNDIDVSAWETQIKREYEKTKNVDEQLTNRIYSHKRNMLLDQRQRYIGHAMSTLMRGYKNGN